MYVVDPKLTTWRPHAFDFQLYLNGYPEEGADVEPDFYPSINGGPTLNRPFENV